MVVNTPSAYKHEYAWLTSSSKHFVFELRACKDAYIALTETPHVTTDGAYELVIGGSGNTKQVLYAAVQLLTFQVSSSCCTCHCAAIYTAVYWQTTATVCFASQGLCQVEKNQNIREKLESVWVGQAPARNFFFWGGGGSCVLLCLFVCCSTYMFQKIDMVVGGWGLANSRIFLIFFST